MKNLLVIFVSIFCLSAAAPAKVYRAHCYDDSHGLRKYWCGPQQDYYKDAAADAKEHKKLGSNHEEKVCDGPSGISGGCSVCPD